jgi:small subunit ribosomal protein S4
MISGPKYKIARRVGAPIFEKTQNRKYAERAERRAKNSRFSKPKSEFGIQFNEKQKARFIYGMTENQFSNYVKEALDKKTPHTLQTIFEFLESRLDNVVYRLGLAPTRRAARQMVTHGHIVVGSRKATTPSRRMTVGEVISIREGSKNSPLFVKANADERALPAWLHFDQSKKSAEIIGKPDLSQSDTMFDLNAVVEFYSR